MLFNRFLQRVVPLMLGLVMTSLFAVVYVTQAGMMERFFKRLDYLLYDIRYNLVPRQPLTKVQSPQGSGAARTFPTTDSPIVIIDLDERSLAEQGRWPWSRRTMHSLVAAVKESGVLMLGFDVLFAEPERNLIDELLDWARLSEPTRRALESQRAALDPDVAFAEQLKALETVLGFFWRSDQQEDLGVLPAPILRSNQVGEGIISDPRWITMPRFSGNLPIFQASAVGAGFLSAFPDADGVIRRMPLVVAHQGEVYGTLALEMARLLWFLESVGLETVAVDGHEGASSVISGVRLGQYFLPTDAHGQVLIPFAGPARSFPYVSATDFLTGRVSKGQYEGYIALMGASALGLKDLRTTVVGIDYPGVEIHANVLRGILSLPATPDYFAWRPDFVLGATLVWILSLGALLSCILPFLNPPAMVLTSASFLAASLGANAFLWRRYGLDFPPGPGLTLWLILSSFYFLRTFLLVNLQRRRIREIFGQYVPEAHVQSMLDAATGMNYHRARLAGTTKEMTVLFSDIRNFTSISEGLSAVKLKKMLELFFTPITEIIFKYGGTVDKYVGDMVMAFWGAPLSDPNHAQKAVLASLAMLDRVEALKAEFTALRLPKISVGVGVSTGLMHVGDMGSKFRRTYTVIGDAVNLGARLENLTKFYDVKLLISEATEAQCSGVLCLLVDRIRVKGQARPVQIYAPLCPLEGASEQQVRTVAEFHWFLFCYYNRRWAQAQAYLATALAVAPGHRLFELYQVRIMNLRAQHLGADWDGVYTHRDK
jgi:adenylate cyclase